MSRTRLPVIYIAGKFRGANAYEVSKNVAAAEALAFEVWKAGAVALCPHLNTAHFDGALEDRVFLEGDLELLARCDAILMHANSGTSAGAQAERAFAKQHGIPVFYTVMEAAVWMHERGRVLANEQRVAAACTPMQEMTA